LKHLRAASFFCLVLVPASLGAGNKKDAPPPDLPSEHTNASKTLTFRTPAGWEVQAGSGQPETTEARGDGLILRIVRHEGELGLDGMHVECMLVRLAPPMDTFPQVDYEYDFVGGAIGDRRALDSAFVVHYDEPIDGHRDWRQRNLTVVGGGESVCIVAYAPLAVWKKSKPARNLLTAVVESVRF
jgi:hypothetical protein